MNNTAFASIISEYDNPENLGFLESELGEKLLSLINESDQQPEVFVTAEIIAFMLREMRFANLKEAEPFYQPIRLTMSDGTEEQNPPLKLITPEIVQYWEGRIDLARNPILVARYSGLVWTFKNKIVGKQPGVEVCRTHIESILALTQRHQEKLLSDDFQKLFHALALAKTINDSVLIGRCVASIIRKETSVTDDHKPGLWGYAIDLLSGTSKKDVSKVQENQIVHELEGRLSRLMTPENAAGRADPWSAERSVIKLAEYYRRKSLPEELKRVVRSLGIAYHNIFEGATAGQKVGWLEHLHKIYTSFNLKQESTEILIELRALSPLMINEMRGISVPVETQEKELNEHVSKLIGGTFDEALQKITALYVPNLHVAKEFLENLAEPMLLHFVGHKLHDRQGRTVAQVNTLDGHLVLQIAHQLNFSSVPLAKVLESFISKFNVTADLLVDYLKQASVFEDDRIEILKKGFESYLSGDYLVAIHLLIPQIEEAVRAVIQMSGGNVMREGNRGGFELRSLDVLLDDNQSKQIFGEDLSAYLRILLTDQRGWNLRNEIAHGLFSAQRFSLFVANRVIHAILCFGLLRPVAQSQDSVAQE